MFKQNPRHLKSGQQGFMIIEALVAILIFSIGVLGVVGMQAEMLKNNSESKYRADASYIAQQQVGMLWADTDNLPADGSTTTPSISGQLPGGAMSITRTGNQFAITVTWQQPGEAKHAFVTNASIAGY